MPDSFFATAWNNGQWYDSGSGYGLKIPAAARDAFFEKTWKTVTLRLLASGTLRTAIVNCDKASFWDDRCRELIGRDIGRWLIDRGWAPWPEGSPPRFRVSHGQKAVFEVAFAA